MQRFHDEANRQGRRPLLILLPTGLDILDYRRSGQWAYAPLVSELERRGLEVLDVAPIFDDLTRADMLEDFFVDGDTGRHLSASGNSLVAQIVHEHMVKRGLLTR